MATFRLAAALSTLLLVGCVEGVNETGSKGCFEMLPTGQMKIRQGVDGDRNGWCPTMQTLTNQQPYHDLADRLGCYSIIWSSCLNIPLPPGRMPEPKPAPPRLLPIPFPAGGRR